MIKQLFEKDVARALSELCDDLNGKKILVALSGGADSVCLLTVLNSFSEKMGFSLCAMHINHMIRGEEADRDQSFCEQLCASKGLKIEAVRIDVPSEAKNSGKSIELCARELRYKALFKHCEENGIDFIATAHNANDNAETVMYNILRGSGIDGLCGIPAKRDNIIRPILGKTRKEIVEYLESLGSAYVTDSTNLENDYTRNYIRNVLLPCAMKVNGDAVGALNKLSKAAQTDTDYFSNVINGVLTDGKPCKLNDLPDALQIRAVRSLCLKKCGFTLGSKHTLAICKGLNTGGEKRFNIPGGYIALTCNGMLSFEKADTEVCTIAEKELTEGKNYFANGAVCVELRSGTYRKGLEFADRCIFSVSLSKAEVKGGLYVRARTTGDSYVVRKINRNVKKCFINKKVPASIRDMIPIICDDDGIVFVPFIGAADRVFDKKCKDTYNLTVSVERVGQQ